MLNKASSSSSSSSLVNLFDSKFASIGGTGKDNTQNLRLMKPKVSTQTYASTRNVIVIGPTGAGKSKLINAILAEPEIVPSEATGAAVTACPISLYYRKLPENKDSVKTDANLLELVGDIDVVPANGNGNGSTERRRTTGGLFDELDNDVEMNGNTNSRNLNTNLNSATKAIQQNASFLMEDDTNEKARVDDKNNNSKNLLTTKKNNMKEEAQAPRPKKYHVRVEFMDEKEWESILEDLVDCWLMCYEDAQTQTIPATKPRMKNENLDGIQAWQTLQQVYGNRFFPIDESSRKRMPNNRTDILALLKKSHSLIGLTSIFRSYTTKKTDVSKGATLLDRFKKRRGKNVQTNDDDDDDTDIAQNSGDNLLSGSSSTKDDEYKNFPFLRSLRERSRAHAKERAGGNNRVRNLFGNAVVNQAAGDGSSSSSSSNLLQNLGQFAYDKKDDENGNSNDNVKESPFATNNSNGSSFFTNNNCIELSEFKKDMPLSHLSLKEPVAHRILGRYCEFSRDVGSSVGRFVRHFVTKDGSRVWPMVRKVEIGGPWPFLEGMHLCDCAGFGDTNKTRSEMASNLIESADTILICVGAGRASSDRPTMEFLGGPKMRQLQRRKLGQSAIGFIATKTDEMLLHIKRSEFGPEVERMNREELALTNNNTIRKKIEKQLIDLNFSSKGKVLIGGSQKIKENDISTNVPKNEEVVQQDDVAETSKNTKKDRGVFFVITTSRNPRLGVAFKNFENLALNPKCLIPDLVVDEVVDGSPAAERGVQPGDRLLAAWSQGSIAKYYNLSGLCALCVRPVSETANVFEDFGMFIFEAHDKDGQKSPQLYKEVKQLTVRKLSDREVSMCDLYKSALTCDGVKSKFMIAQSQCPIFKGKFDRVYDMRKQWSDESNVTVVNHYKSALKNDPSNLRISRSVINSDEGKRRYAQYVKGDGITATKDSLEYLEKYVDLDAGSNNFHKNFVKLVKNYKKRVADAEKENKVSKTTNSPPAFNEEFDTEEAAERYSNLYICSGDSEFKKSGEFSYADLTQLLDLGVELDNDQAKFHGAFEKRQAELTESNADANNGGENNDLSGAADVIMLDDSDDEEEDEEKDEENDNDNMDIDGDNNKTMNVSDKAVASNKNKKPKLQIITKCTIPIFMVSPLDALRNMKLDPAAPATFTSIENTEIPALRDFIMAQAARDRAGDNKDQLLRLQKVCGDFNLMFGDNALTSVETRQQLAGAATAAKMEIETAIETSNEHKTESLLTINAQVDSLLTKFGEGVSRSNNRASNTASSWGGVRWNTYKATGKRGGVWGSADWNEEQAKHLWDEAQENWNGFFESYGNCKEDLKSEIKALETDYFDEMLNKLKVLDSKLAALCEADARVLLDNASGNWEIEFNDLWNNFKNNVQEAQRCEDSVKNSIERKFNNAYASNVNQSGTGCFMRMKQAMASTFQAGAGMQQHIAFAKAKVEYIKDLSISLDRNLRKECALKSAFSAFEQLFKEAAKLHPEDATWAKNKCASFENFRKQVKKLAEETAQLLAEEVDAPIASAAAALEDTIKKAEAKRVVESLDNGDDGGDKNSIDSSNKNKNSKIKTSNAPAFTDNKSNFYKALEQDRIFHTGGDGTIMGKIRKMLRIKEKGMNVEEIYDELLEMEINICEEELEAAIMEMEGSGMVRTEGEDDEKMVYLKI